MKTVHNVIANVGGRFWQVLMNFAFIPFYIKLMGVEAYGLVGVFATMLAIFGVLDMGLSLAVNRELVRLQAASDRARSRNLVRTLELIYAVVGSAIALIIYSGASFITHRWLNLSQLSVDTATRAVQMMSIIALLRWPGALYTGVLMGLRQHVVFNVIMAFIATLSGAGALLVLWLVSSSVTAFFVWQIIASAIQMVLLIGASWRALRMPGHRAKFDAAPIRAIFHFSAGIAGVTILSIILMQLDKLVLSSTLTLADFGYYSLAFTIGNVLATISLAIHGALFPSLSHVTAIGSDNEIAPFYHKCCLLMAVAIIPAGTVLAFFAPDLLQLYLHDPIVVHKITGLVTVFAIASTLFALMVMPYALQLAFGWTKLSIYKNIIAIVIYIPMLIVMVRYLGAIGAALTWLALVIGYFIFEVNIMHRRLLIAEKGKWYVQDVAIPFLLSIGIIGTAKIVALADIPLLARIGLAALGATAATVAIVMTSPPLREFGCAFFATVRPRIFRERVS